MQTMHSQTLFLEEFLEINFRPGIEPGTQRLGVQYTKHQAITQDKSLSPHSSLCTASGHWRICQPHTGVDARTEVYLSVLFLPHLCQQSNYYHTISRWTKNSNNIWTVNPPILAPPLMGRCSSQPLKGF